MGNSVSQVSLQLGLADERTLLLMDFSLAIWQGVTICMSTAARLLLSHQAVSQQPHS